MLELALADPSLSPAQALDMQRKRVQALRDPTSPQALDVLARQLPVLEALWQNFSVQSLRARTAADRAALLRVALHAQGAHSRTFALLHALSGPGEGRGRVCLDMDEA
ncbi:MAG: hypothetical protein IH627_12380 [Rubrivivax sp.]|nr:hypothetical protein [Rubrivivax sp.]